MLIEPRESSLQVIEKYLLSRNFQVVAFGKLDDAIANLILQTPACLVLSGEAYDSKVAEVYTRTRDLALAGGSSLVVIIRPKQADQIPAEDLRQQRISVLVHPFQLRDLRKEITRLLSEQSQASNGSS